MNTFLALALTSLAAGSTALASGTDPSGSVAPADAPSSLTVQTPANTTPPQVVAPTNKFSLPSPAKAADLSNTRVLPERLIPVGGTPTAADNLALAAALTTYASSRDLKALEGFVKAHGSSPWLVSVSTNLGLLEFQEGYFSKAMAAWQVAWTRGKSATDPAAQPIVDLALSELLTLYDRVGRVADSEALLAQVGDRSFRGSTANRIADARQAVGMMRLHPADAFKCGPYAVSNLLSFLHRQTGANTAIIKAFTTTEQGTSLAQVLALANQVGLKMQAARRAPGAALPLPAIVNWKLNHYGALLREEGGRYLLVDPTFGTSEWVLVDAVDQESSGYFLIADGPLPSGWHPVDSTEAGTVWGRGLGSGPDPHSTKGGGDGGGGGDGQGGGDNKCPTGNCNTPPKAPGSGGPVYGMAQWGFFTMLASLSINDAPLVYQPPVGPTVVFKANYAAAEENQPATINYSNLGPLWNFSWLSSITFDSANAYVSLGGGGTEDYVNFNAATQSYDPDPQSACTLVKVSASTYERRDPDNSKLVFSIQDPSGRIYLTKLVDPQGNALTMSYDANFRLMALTDAIGQVTTLNYGSNTVGASLFYNISKVTDPFGRYASFSYNGSGQLIQITDELGLQSQFTYGANDFIQTLTTPYGATQFTSTKTNTQANGAVTSLVAMEPDGAQQRVDSVQISTVTPDSDVAVPVGMPVTNLYLSFRNSYFWGRKAMHDAPGDYTQALLTHFLHLDGGTVESGIIESTKDALESRVWYFYQNQNPAASLNTNAGMLANPIYIGQVLDDGTTQLIQSTYNAQGFPTQFIDPVGRTTNYAYAANGIDLLSITQGTSGGGSDQLATFTWNNAHRLLTETGADGETSVLAYNGQGQLLSYTNAKGETSSRTYDTHGYLAAYQGAMAGAADHTTYAYDSFGRVQTITDGDGYVLTYGYDALNRPTSIAYPDGTSDQVTFTYLQPTQYTDRLGRITTLVYNSIQQVMSVTDPLNRTTRYTRCSCGDILKLTDPLGQTTTWTYDVETRPTSKTYPDGSVETYNYANTNGRLVSVTDAKKQIRSYAYNLDDSLSSISYFNAQTPTASVTFKYDPYYLRLSAMSDGMGGTAYTYYPVTGTLSLGANQLATVIGPLNNSQITYTYDALGRALTTSLNGVSESVAYDALGRIPTVTNALGTFNYTYENASHRITQITRPNQQTITASFLGNNGNHRLQQIKNFNVNGTSLSEFDYTYNAVGNVLTWTQATDANAGVGSTLSYNAGDELTGVSASGQTYGYTYDVAGNRLTQTAGGATSTFAYNPLDQLQQVSPALGNDKTYLWDAEDRLVGINYTGTSLSTRLSYDGMGRCLQILELNGTSVTSTKRFVWNGLSRYEEHDAQDNVTRRFFNQGEQIGGSNYYYTADHFGSVQEMTDASGNLRARYSYDPYGVRTKVSGDLDASSGFSGIYYHAPSALHLATYRAYNASLGQWLSRDPIPAVNGYDYVDGNPARWRDPRGLCKTELRYAHVLGDTYHAYILTTDTNGTRTVYEAGPNYAAGAGAFGTDLFGFLTPSPPDVYPFVEVGPQTPLRDKSPNDPSQVLGTNDRPCACNKPARDYNDRITNARIPYNPLFENSNAYATGLANILGFQPQGGPVTAPGWDQPLPTK